MCDIELSHPLLYASSVRRDVLYEDHIEVGLLSHDQVVVVEVDRCVGEHVGLVHDAMIAPLICGLLVKLLAWSILPERLTAMTARGWPS